MLVFKRKENGKVDLMSYLMQPLGDKKGDAVSRTDVAAMSQT